MAVLPVFIGGFRSGTTLLINLLGMHAEVTPWFETKELCEALRWQHVIDFPADAGFEAGYSSPNEPAGFTAEAVAGRMRWHMRDTQARIAGSKASGKAGHERYPLGNDYVLYSPQEAEAAVARWQEQTGSKVSSAQVAAATGDLIRTLAARQQGLHGGTCWINKTPEITRFAPGLRASLGPCRIIYLVRDGVQVVTSGHRLNWGTIETLAFNWKELLLRTRAAMQAHAEHYLEIRYEDLLLHPTATLDRVLAFTDCRTEARQIVDNFTQRFGAGAFDTSRLAAALNADVLRRFNAVAGDLQASLGYAN